MVTWWSNYIRKLWKEYKIILVFKSISYSQRIFAAYAESGHFLVTIGPKRGKNVQNTVSTIPQLIMNSLFWIMYHITASQIQACGKDKIAQYVLLPSSLPFSFVGHSLHFTSVEKVFFAKPWGWWNYFEGSTGVGTGETRFSLEFSDHNYYSGLFDREMTKLNHNRYACGNNINCIQ